MRILSIITLALVTVQLLVAQDSSRVIPDDLRSALKRVDAHIEGGASLKESSDCIDYLEIKQGFERNWWKIAGLSKQPTTEEMERNFDLKHFALVVKLSSEGFCTSTKGIQRLLCGGAAGDAIMPARPLSAAKVEVIHPEVARFVLLGFDGRPVIAVFKKKKADWMLSEVELSVRAPLPEKKKA